jgi:uncharacterized protein YndB with AHSA1/START domain
VEIEQQVVRREMVLPVDRDTAWAALRDAEGLETWLADEVELEVREGARGTVRWRTGEERLVEVEEVRERRRIALSWCEPGGEPSVVELTLDDVPGGTRLVVIELPTLTLRAFAGALDARGGAASGPRMVAALA